MRDWLAARIFEAAMRDVAWDTDENDPAEIPEIYGMAQLAFIGADAFLTVRSGNFTRRSEAEASARGSGSQ